MKKVLSFVLVLVLMLSVFPMVSITAEGEATGKIEGAALNIGSSLTLDYYATFENIDAENTTMKFTSVAGDYTEVAGVYDDTQKMYKFSYKGINPQCMADVIKAELVYDDTVIAVKDGYSVKEYCDSLITRNDLGYTTQQLAAFKTLIADMLTYGAIAQKYRGYNTENPADASDWIKYNVSTFQNAIGVREVIGNADTENKAKSVGLNMANVNRIYFKFIATDSAIVKLNGKIVDVSTLGKSDGAYMLYTEDIKATGFDDVYTFTIENNGNVVTTVRYNVNAYIATKCNDAEVGDITKALYNYGVSAEKFQQALKAQTEGGDFDLGEEDVLEDVTSVLPEKSSTFETAIDFKDTGWSVIDPIITKELVEDEFGKCVHFVRDTTKNYSSPAFTLDKYVDQPGVYTISFNYKVEGATEGETPFRVIIRTNKDTSFSNASGSSYFDVLNDKVKGAKNGQWETMTVSFSVEEADLKDTTLKPWRFCMDVFQTDMVTDVYIDNFVITKQVYDFTAVANEINETETWVSNELVLVSDKKYDDPFNEVEVDLVLTHQDGTKIEIPGFWDGGKTWRVRFACPSTGEWTYTTVCNDTTNTGLHNVTNTLTCTKYSGDLEIYKHGFIKTQPGTRYFIHADGTPFFYLGDTHWALGNETIDMVETITEHRVNQGYTVWQSEPIGVEFTYYDGIGSRDILQMKKFDEKFKIIADAGLVHTNSQFFFASDISKLIYANGGYNKEEPCATKLIKDGKEYTFYDISDKAKTYLDKICRYWIARYSSYPVMWTLGQEVDNDLYWMEESGDTGWSYVNNPFRYMAQYLNEHDPYKSPLSAHQEAHGTTAATDSYPAVDGKNGATDITTLNLRFNIRGGATAGNSVIIETANNPEVANIKGGASDSSTGKTVVKNVVQGLKLEITEDFDSGFAYYIMSGGLTADMVANNNVTNNVILYNPSSVDITVRVHYMKPDWAEAGNAVTATIPAGGMKVVKLEIPCNADGTYDSTTTVSDLQLRVDIRSELKAGNAIVVANENGAEVPSVISAAGNGNTTGKIAVTNINDSTPIGVKFNITETFTNNAIAYYLTNGCLTGDMAAYSGSAKAITKTFVIHNPSNSAVTVETAYYDGWSLASGLTKTETIPAGESKEFTISIKLGTISSAFRGVAAHTWYANQWKPNINGTALAGVTNVAKDYWYNGQGKPVVNYEADYCFLYTKNFGARAQGWFAYLSGMFGHGYGAQDTWCYLSGFREDVDSSDGVDTITAAEKQAATWEDALEYESSYQLGYMKKFFTETVGDWYNLIPRFDDKEYLTRETRTYRGWSSSDTGTAYAYIASKEDSSKVVVYFYNFSDKSLAQTTNAKTGWSGIDGSYDFGTLTGTLGNLEANTTYNYMWFNPVTGQVTGTGTKTSDSSGKLIIPAKTTGDMVFYLYK